MRDIEGDYKSVKNSILEICKIDLNDQAVLELKELENSQDKRIYSGYRTKLKMIFLEEHVRIDCDIDIGIGNQVTPEIQKMEF